MEEKELKNLSLKELEERIYNINKKIVKLEKSSNRMNIISWLFVGLNMGFVIAAARRYAIYGKVDYFAIPNIIAIVILVLVILFPINFVRNKK